MSGWHAFEGEIVTMPWGDAIYTVLPLPDDVAEALQAQGARRIEGEINDHPVNLALTTAPVIDGVFLYAGKAAMAEWGVAPGEPIDVRLRKTDPDRVEVPDDVLTALRAAGLTADWQALSAGRQRGLLHPVTSAKRPDTRTRRIQALLAEVRP